MNPICADHQTQAVTAASGSCHQPPFHLADQKPKMGKNACVCIQSCLKPQSQQPHHLLPLLLLLLLHLYSITCRPVHQPLGLSLFEKGGGGGGGHLLFLIWVKMLPFVTRHKSQTLRGYCHGFKSLVMAIFYDKFYTFVDHTVPLQYFSVWPLSLSDFFYKIMCK